MFSYLLSYYLVKILKVFKYIISNLYQLINFHFFSHVNDEVIFPLVKLEKINKFELSSREEAEFSVLLPFFSIRGESLLIYFDIRWLKIIGDDFVYHHWGCLSITHHCLIPYLKRSTSLN